MTDAEKMRSKILDLAIRGRLVVQDPHDEPVSTLLAQIYTEKEKLAREKGKKYTPPAPISADEIPFEIPAGWQWVRLGDFVQIISGVSYQKTDILEAPSLETGIRILRGGNVKDDTLIHFNEDDVFLPLQYADEEMSLHVGDIVVVASTGSRVVIGRPAIVEEDAPRAQIGAFLRIVRSSYRSLTSWFHVIFRSNYYRQHIREVCKGTNIKNLKSEYISKLPVPFPPLAEQRRIVAKTEALLEVVAKMGVAEAGLQGTASRIDRKLLDLAIRGALVPQDLHDEPAFALLERIYAEKEKAAKEKGRKVVPPMPIPDDEIPFELPEGWMWVRLGDVSTYGECVNVLAQELPGTTWALDLEEIEKGTGRLLVRRTIGEKNVVGTRHAFSRGMILYSRLRTYLNKVLIADEDGVCSSEMIPFDVGGGILPEYIRHVLMSDYALRYTAEKGYGVKMPRLGTDDARRFPIPLPPLAEQRRIVEKVNAVRAALAPLRNES